MDNHPIPQDITGFQFKLIGNMTVKQFIYLAIGAVLAWLFFFMINFPTIIKWPLSFLAISIGAIFAFVPVDGRPMDTMLANFIRAITSPTQYVYQKQEVKIDNQPAPLPSVSNAPSTHAPIPDMTTLNQTQVISQPINPTIQAQTPIPPQQVFQTPAPAPIINPLPIQAPPPPPQMKPQSVAPTMTIESIEKPEEIKNNNKELENLKEKNGKLEEELSKLKKQFEEALKAKEEEIKTQTTAPVQTTPASMEQTPNQKELEKELIEANRQREALQNAFLIQQAKAQTPTQGVTPSAMPETPKLPTQRVRSITPGMEKAAGIPSMPESPNLITGIVKDPRGNPLQNILIEVKDQDANPVRAFKTNGLGKFASATPLSNGKYLITFEDTKEVNKFDAVEIELVGTPFMPLEIISIDPREELRRELFK